MRSSDLPNELIDRGIYWQVGGFTLAAVASVAILAEFSGSELRAFIYFEIAVTRLYWALVIPLAGLFDGARKMFEKMSDIRAKRRQRWLDEGPVGKVTRKAAGRSPGRPREGHQEGRRQERERMRAELQRLAADLPPEVVASLLDEPDHPSEQRGAPSV